MKLIKQLIQKHTERKVRMEDMELTGMFKVVEKHGSLWLTCGGVAFEEIGAGLTSQEIACALWKARSCARKFRKETAQLD